MKTKYFALAALAAIAAGCSNDDENIMAPVENLKDTPITITAGVEGMNTRAGYEGTTLPTTFYLTLDRTTAVISAPGTAADIQAYLSGTSAEAIFVPSASAEKTEFTITITTLINDVERVFKATASAPGGFASGIAYTVNLVLGGETVNAVTAQSTAWVDMNETPQDIETH